MARRDRCVLTPWHFSPEREVRADKALPLALTLQMLAVWGHVQNSDDEAWKRLHCPGSSELAVARHGAFTHRHPADLVGDLPRKTELLGAAER